MNQDLYSKDEVKRLLINYRHLDELNAFNQDGMPIIYKIDIDRALSASCLHMTHTKVIALHYACELSLMQIQMYEGTPIAENMVYLEEAVDIITGVLNGELDTNFYKPRKTNAKSLKEFVYYVSLSFMHPYDVSDAVQIEILELTKELDILAKETLRQRIEGKPVFEDIEKTLYPCHDEYVHSKSYRDDYFINQDRKNGVVYDDLESFATGQITTGYKKVNTTNDSIVNKRVVKR